MEIVLPGDTDAPVYLDAVLHQVDHLLADVELGRTGPLRSDVPSFVEGLHRTFHGGMRCLEPELHVGQAVLDHLIGGERAPEGPTIGCVVEGEGEDVLGRPNHLGALHDVGNLGLAAQDDHARLDPDDDLGTREDQTRTGEIGVAADQVEAGGAHPAQPRHVGRHNQVCHPLVQGDGNQQVVGVGS